MSDLPQAWNKSWALDKTQVNRSPHITVFNSERIISIAQSPRTPPARHCYWPNGTGNSYRRRPYAISKEKSWEMCKTGGAVVPIARCHSKTLNSANVPLGLSKSRHRHRKCIYWRLLLDEDEVKGVNEVADAQRPIEMVWGSLNVGICLHERRFEFMQCIVINVANVFMWGKGDNSVNAINSMADLLIRWLSLTSLRLADNGLRTEVAGLILDEPSSPALS